MLNEELNDLVKKHLPAQVGETLQAELAELARLREQVKSQASEIATIREENNIHIVANERLRVQLATHESLAERERKVAEREFRQEMAQLRVEQAELRRADAFAMVSLVFKSPVYKTHIQGTIPVPVEGHPGGGPGNAYPTMGTVFNSPIDKTTTISQE